MSAERQPAPEVGLTEAEREAALRAHVHISPAALLAAVARIKADAIAQERAAWVAKVGMLDKGHTSICRFPDGECFCAIRLLDLRALSSDATETPR